MKTNNSFGKIGFILDHIFWAFWWWMWYKNILFRCLTARSFTESKLILGGIVAVSCLVGFLFEMKKSRNGISVLFNLLMGYGVYTVLTYIQIRRNFIIICLSAAGSLSVIYALIIMCKKIRNRKNVIRIIRRRIIHVIVTTQRIMGAGLALIMVVSGVNILFGSTIMKSSVSTISKYNANVQTISSNMKTLILLQEDVWELLPVQKRLDVLQTVANIEQRYLGLPTELNVGAANLNDNRLAFYSDKTHEIVIDMDSLLYDSSDVLLDSVCHEAFHSYQHRMVEVFDKVDDNSKNLRMFRKVFSYENEFDNYVSGEEDFCSYYNQNCESDAREYAEDAVQEYYRRINEYLEGN